MCCRWNIDDSHTPGNHTAETELPGWGERVRPSNGGIKIRCTATIRGEPVVGRGDRSTPRCAPLAPREQFLQAKNATRPGATHSAGRRTARRAMRGMLCPTSISRDRSEPLEI